MQPYVRLRVLDAPYWFWLMTKFRPAAILASSESDQDVIDGFFHRFLNRAEDIAGINYYVSLLQQGTSWEDIEASIIGSAEYLARAQA